MLLQNIKDLQFILNVYNTFINDRIPDDTPKPLMDNLFDYVVEHCAVLTDRYKGSTFRVKSYSWQSRLTEWTIGSNVYPLLEFKLVKEHRGMWSVRFAYEDDSLGGYIVENVALFETPEKVVYRC